MFLSGFWMEQCTSSCFYYGCFSIIWAPYFTMTSNPWRLVWWWMGANQTIQLSLQPSGDSSLHCGSQPVFNSELLNLFCFANHVSGRFELRMRRRSWCKIHGARFRVLTIFRWLVTNSDCLQWRRWLLILFYQVLQSMVLEDSNPGWRRGSGATFWVNSFGLLIFFNN